MAGQQRNPASPSNIVILGGVNVSEQAVAATSAKANKEAAVVKDFAADFTVNAPFAHLVDVEQGGLSSQDMPFPLLPQLLIVTTIPCLNESPIVQVGASLSVSCPFFTRILKREI